MKVLTLILLIISFAAFAVSIKEIQELRLAKAELAYTDGDIKGAMQHLRQNLILKSFHLESYLFLFKVYREQKHFAKALKVGRFLAKKLHSKIFVNVVDLGELEHLYSKATVPSETALLIYFHLGLLYYEMYSEGIFSEIYTQRFNKLANKYFLVCLHYDFNIGQTNFYLGLLKREKEKHNEAIEHLISAQEAYEQWGEETEQMDQLEVINYLLGDSLIQEGYSDAGGIYLRGVQSSSYATGLIKDYANSYLDSMAAGNKYFSMALGYGLEHSDNIHSMRDDQLANFETLYRPYYVATKGTKEIKSLDIFSSFQMGKYWSCVAIADVEENSAKDRRLFMSDTRGFGGRVDIKYFNLQKSQGKLTYSHSQSYKKTIEGNRFLKEYTTDLVQLQYAHILKRGLLSYQLPLSSVKEHGTGVAWHRGVAINYTPYRTNDYWAPSYSVKLNIAEELEQDAGDSTQLRLFASNHMALSKLVSFFVMISYLNSVNKNELYSYRDYIGGVGLSYLFPFEEKLSLNLNATREIVDYSQGSGLKSFEWSGKLSFLFD